MNDGFGQLLLDSVASTVGYNLGRIREGQGWTVQVLADAMTFRSGGREWVTADDVTNWENGVPTDFLTIFLAAEALAVPLSTLFVPVPGSESSGYMLLAGELGHRDGVQVRVDCDRRGPQDPQPSD